MRQFYILIVIKAITYDIQLHFANFWIISEKLVVGLVSMIVKSLLSACLFISFLIAFAGKPKTTFFYALSGSVLIYTINIVRIAVLSIGLYHYPWRRDILHTVIFPLLIYGMVFILWMVWVRRFSYISIKNNE